MAFLRSCTPVQGILLIAVFAIVIASILLVTQSYFSYVEVTEAANGCFDQGGFPVIEKSGFQLISFQCNRD